jgi:hypothetical protein
LSAPLSTSRRKHASWPKKAAMLSGVEPSFASTRTSLFAPASSSRRTQSTWPPDVAA